MDLSYIASIPNHVHLILVSSDPDGLRRAFARARIVAMPTSSGATVILARFVGRRSDSETRRVLVNRD